MANTRSKATSKRKKPTPLPEHFTNPIEAGEFWDTHDSADYEGYLNDVECEVEIKQRSYLISLDSDLYRKVSSIAQNRGVSAETLINLWVQEKAF